MVLSNDFTSPFSKCKQQMVLKLNFNQKSLYSRQKTQLDSYDLTELLAESSKTY